MEALGMWDRTKDWALGLAIANQQKLGQPRCPLLYNHAESPIPEVGHLGNGLVASPVTPWTKDLRLGKMVSDVWQIPDYLYSPSGP